MATNLLGVRTWIVENRVFLAKAKEAGESLVALTCPKCGQAVSVEVSTTTKENAWCSECHTGLLRITRTSASEEMEGCVALARAGRKQVMSDDGPLN
jgi:hypothetical protein